MLAEQECCLRRLIVMNLLRTVFQALRGLIIGLLSLIAVLALARLFIALPPGENFIRGIVQDQISRILGQRLFIQSLETDLFSSLKLQHVVLYSIPPESSRPLASIASLEIHYHLLPLLHHRLAISSLRLDSLVIDLVRDSTAVFNLELLNHTEPETATVNTRSELILEITDATVHRGDLAYLDQVDGYKSVRLEGLECTVEGRNGRYIANLKVDSGVVAYRELELPLHALDLKAILNPGEYIVDHLSAQLPGMELAAAAAARRDSISHPLDGMDYTLQGKLRLQGDLALLADSSRSLLPPPFFPFKGKVDLTLDLGGSAKRPMVKMDLALKNTQLSNLHVSQGFIQARWRRDLISLDGLEFDLLGGNLSAQGDLALDSLRYQLAATFEGLESDQIWDLFHRPKPPYQAETGGQIRASGFLLNSQSWDAVAALQLRRIKYLHQSLADVTLNFGLQHGSASLDLRQAQTHVQASGQFDGKSLRGQFTADILQLQSLSGLAGVNDLTGEVRLQGTVAGRFNAPEVAASLQAVDLRYRNFPVDSLSGSLVFNGKKLFLQEITFKGAMVSIDTTAQPFGLRGLQGGFDYWGHAEGPMDSLIVDLAANMQNIALNSLRFDEGVIRARLAESKVDLTLLKLRRENLVVQGMGDFLMSERSGNLAATMSQVSAGNSLVEDTTLVDIQKDSGKVAVSSTDKISAAFSLPRTGGLSVKMAGQNIRIEEILALVSEQPVKHTLKKPFIRGYLDFDLSVAGTLLQPRAQLDFRMSEIAVKTFEVDSTLGRAVFECGQLTLETFEISQKEFHTRGEASVALSGSGPTDYTLTEDSPTRGAIQGDSMDVAMLQAFLPPEITARGRVSYDLNWNGTVSEPHPQGKVILEQGSAQLPGNVPPIENLMLQADLLDFRVKIDPLIGTVQKIPFSLSGTVDLTSRKNLDLDLNLAVSDQAVLSARGSVATDRLQLSTDIQDLNLAVLQPLVASVENLGGTLTASLKIDGSLHEPQLNGHLKGRGLTFKSAGLRDSFQDGLIIADFQNNRIVLDTLFLGLKGGSIFASGEGAYQNSRLDEVNLTARASGLTLEEPKAYSVSLDSALITYTSQGDLLNLDGDIYLGKSKITTNFDATALLPLKRRVERPIAEPSPFMTATRMDLRLHGGKEVKVENNVANMMLAPELSLVGTMAAPNVTGHVSVVKGSVTFLDRKFTVTRGLVDFADPVKINPILDIAAKTTIRRYQGLEAVSYDINLVISGPADTLIVELTSDPPLERPNIISLLTLGATREQLTGIDSAGAQTSSGDILVQRAQTLTTYVLSGALIRNLGSRLGLESLTLQGNIFRAGQSGGAGPSLEAAKQVSDRLLITYTTNVGHFNENGIKVDYLLTKYFSLQGQSDQTGQSGIDLKYSIRFK